MNAQVSGKNDGVTWKWLVGAVIVSIIVAVTLIYYEPYLLGEKKGQSIDTTGAFLDKMSCNDIKDFINEVGTQFTSDYQADAIKAHASELMNKCLESVDKYVMAVDTSGNVKYYVNGTWKHLEMTH